MKKLVFLFTFLCSIVFGDSYDETYMEYMKIIRQDELISSIIGKENLSNMIDKQFKQLDIKTKEKLTKVFSKFIDNIVSDEINSISTLMKKYFTQEDLKELIEFYKTPIGQKSIEANIKMQSDVQMLLTQILDKNLPFFKKEIQNIIAESK